MNGTPVATSTRVDDPGQTLTEDRAKHATLVEKEYEEEWNLPKSHTEMITATQIKQKQLMEDLQQKAKKSESKFDLENRNTRRSSVAENGNFAFELIRDPENKEEEASPMVQNDLMIIKEKIRQLELGSSGSTLGSDPSTAVGTGPSGTGSNQD